MSNDQFECLFLESEDGKSVTHSFQTMGNESLPEGNVTVAIKYSTLNYKDGMIINGLGRMVRNYPHVPGIDFCGVVEESSSPDHKPGDEVILTGWGVGENHWGGFAQRARVKSDWLVPLPTGLSLRQSMAIGTAGLTAMLAIMAMEDNGLTNNVEKDILVTGAAGGVGSVAVSLLANLGYNVAAGTGRAETHDYLRDLGATTVVSREELEETPKGPLSRETWAGIIDNVGGVILGNALPSLAYWGTAASVGNASGIEFTSNVLPFLLRGINLCGINSSHIPKARRVIAWDRLAADLPSNKLDGITEEAPLTQLPELATKILQGKVRGRTVITLED